MKVKKGKKQWQVYLVECADKTFYCGVTTDLKARLVSHNKGNASKYTRSRRPVVCVATSPFMEKSRAFSLEYQVKKLPRHKKISWVETGACPKV
jgi:putative endonuclease